MNKPLKDGVPLNCKIDKKTAEPATAEEQALGDSAAEKPLMVGVTVDGTPAQDEVQAEESVVQNLDWTPQCE